jgi:tRNA pseudouridine38-40 synthase
MKTWKLVLEYEGTKYHGWQEQSNARTVAGVLRQTIEEVFGTAVELMGSGRTDSGVHALAQVAHVKAARAPRKPDALLLSELNERLPADIAIHSMEPAGNRFQARHDAVLRAYIYQIATRKSAFNKRHVWWIRQPLDLQAMADAAALLPGRHDFVRFAQKDPSKPNESTIVVVEQASIGVDDELIVFRIAASHFLWKMVRRVTGAIVKVGLSELSVEQFRQLRDARITLPVAEWTAPASGLFLEKVVYQDES